MGDALVISGVGEVSWMAPHWIGVWGGEDNMLLFQQGAFDIHLLCASYYLTGRYAQALNTLSSWLFLYRCRDHEMVYPNLLRTTIFGLNNHGKAFRHRSMESSKTSGSFVAFAGCDKTSKQTNKVVLGSIPR